jgi:accessory gene regulator protein AgrB
VKALAERVGLYRVAAILIACALVLEVLRVQALGSSRTASVACTLGEVVFLALAAGVFLIARRRTRRPGVRH